MLRVEDHAQIQQPGLIRGKALVVAHGVEKVLGQGEPLLAPVEIEGVIVKIVPLGGIRVGHNHGTAGHQL